MQFRDWQFLSGSQLLEFASNKTKYTSFDNQKCALYEGENIALKHEVREAL